jgi:hypothetical protein
MVATKRSALPMTWEAKKGSDGPRVERSGQSVVYVYVIRCDVKDDGTRHTVRLTIHANAYASQSWAKAERWDGTQWHEVATIRGAALRVEDGLYARTDDYALDARRFSADVQTLLLLVEEVLVA